MAKFNRMDFLYQQWMNKWDSHPYLEELFLLWEGRWEPSVINESILSCMKIFIYNTSTVYFYQYQNCFWLWMWIWYTEFHVFILGLMSVTAQHLDYLKTALKTLEVSSENQYKIRGQPRFDKVSWEVKRSYCLIVQCYQQLRALNIN